jgi:predicted metal-dependent phosphoesterase TrpH
MIIEIHAHSSQSDGLHTVKEMLTEAEKRVDAIAITDHNTFSGYKIAKKTKTNVLLIPGIEISTDNGHVLCIGIEEVAFKKNMSALELIDITHSQGGIAITAHPCRIDKKVHDKEVFKKADAIEVINGNTPSWFNNKAFKIAGEYRKPKTSGSDAHQKNDIGSYAFSVKAHNLDEILKCVKKDKAILPEKQPTLAYLTKKKSGLMIKKIFS